MDRLCIEHLSDTTTYELLTRNPTNSIRIKINTALKHILTERGFSKALISQLQTPTMARTQVFYALPKTHKETLKIRPIVSAPGGIFDRIGWLLQRLLKPLLKFVQAHLSSTTDLIERLESADKNSLKGKIPISFDVVSLYTNIDTQVAVHTALEYVTKHNIYIYGLQACDLFELLNLVLDHNVFQFGNKLYKQKHGLAMGNRLSGTLAIICMDRFEQTHIYKKYQPVLYGRYVDDIGTTASNIEEANIMLTDLNSRHPTIKFELETPDEDGFLPILDLQVKIDENGETKRRLYTKPANKGITLNFESHQPSATKQAMVSNEMRRVSLYPTPEYIQDAKEKMVTRLINNGYPEQWINSCVSYNGKKRHKTRKKQQRVHHESLFTLKIPFISNNINDGIRRIIKRHKIPARLVNSKGTTLRDVTKWPTTNRHSPCKNKDCPAPQICWKSSVIYRATCKICNQFYIGMTTRRLHDRAREHITSVKQKTKPSAFGDHYKEIHADQKPRISFEIIGHASDGLRLHIEEAIAIQLHNPPLNRKTEQLGTGYLP